VGHVYSQSYQGLCGYPACNASLAKGSRRPSCDYVKYRINPKSKHILQVDTDSDKVHTVVFDEIIRPITHS